MQGDFYTDGKYREKGAQTFDMQKGIDENPTYVVFNGAEGSLLGDRALKANVGERVRIYFGVGGPNLTSSFHVIGAIFDKVYTEGGTHTQENVQTTVVPAGGSSIVEFTVMVPGSYALVDHAIFRAFNKGAVGMLKVDGEPSPQIYSGLQVDTTYVPGQVSPPVAAAAPAPKKDLTKDGQIAAGQKVFQGTCAACHQPTGLGLAPNFPPLAKSDFLLADKHRAIAAILNGLQGPITVNGVVYRTAAMPPWRHLSDDDLANVLTYVLNAFGNDGGIVSPKEIAATRGAENVQ
jgi:nitrite reductase (NO-forming)